jgi:hypothetical protein
MIGRNKKPAALKFGASGLHKNNYIAAVEIINRIR